ncbi:MAG: hypothetical protein ACP5GJ_03605 [Nanopusillaceae archaeon]
MYISDIQVLNNKIDEINCFEDIRKLINEDYVSASYISININGEASTIEKKDLFPLIYGYPSVIDIIDIELAKSMGLKLREETLDYILYINEEREEIKKIMISLKKPDNSSDDFEIRVASRRNDFYVNNRTKLPEAIVLKKDEEYSKKLVNTRYYDEIFDKEFLERENKRLKYENYFVLPSSLLLPILKIMKNNFPEILYVSRPFNMRDIPVNFSIIYGYRDYYVPLALNDSYMNFLVLTDFVKKPTTEFYIIGIKDWKKEFNKEEKIFVSIKKDEFIYRIKNSIELILKNILDTGLVYSDILFYQYVPDEEKNTSILIDIGSPFYIPTNVKKMKRLILNSLKDLIYSFSESRIINYHCKENNEYIECDNRNNYDSSLLDKYLKELIPEDLLRYIEISKPDFEKLIKIVKANNIDYLENIIDLLNSNEEKYKERQELLKEYSLKIIELYKKSYLN